ncbi:hypothetical protein NDU88_000736 [Pleurodeles waltl]|uniref:Death domain-containing protein n=1 Tax=Pleurodeles waltl TaxID=8319 RepID=A0AAV7LYD8_PLEWA|nr:hypothetical protein NDU88_000736 [Pleurodeles waltl]
MEPSVLTDALLKVGSLSFPDPRADWEHEGAAGLSSQCNPGVSSGESLCSAPFDTRMDISKSLPYDCPIDPERNSQKPDFPCVALGASACLQGDGGFPYPERGDQHSRELATTTKAPMSDPSTLRRQSAQPSPGCVDYRVSHRLDCGLTWNLQPEENEEDSALPPCTKHLIKGQRLRAESSTSRPSFQQTPTFHGASNTSTLGYVSCHLPQEETGYTYPLVDVPWDSRSQAGHPQSTDQTLANVLSECKEGVMPVTLASQQGVVLLKPSIPPAGEPLSSNINGLKSASSPGHERSERLSLHELQISQDSSCSSQEDSTCQTGPSQYTTTENAACSSRELDPLWVEATLTEFGKLRDFTPEELKAVSDVFGARQEVLPLNVRELMRTLQVMGRPKEKLRTLANKLKELRMDVVKAMHGQPSLLKYLGPRLPEGLTIKNMKFSDRYLFTTALSLQHPTGHDWRWLADNLCVKEIFIKKWQQTEKDPAEILLREWECKISEATVGKLYDLMLAMDREDLAAML